jgi:ornithine carbamoyltransferase
MTNEEAINFILESQARQAEKHEQLQEQLATLSQRVDAVFFRQADESDELKRAQLGLLSLMGQLAETRRAGDEKLNALIDAQMRTEAHLDQFITEVRRMIGGEEPRRG